MLQKVPMSGMTHDSSRDWLPWLVPLKAMYGAAAWADEE